MQENKTTAEVLAELLLEMKEAERNYVRNLKSAPSIKKSALDHYKNLSDRAENYAYAICNPMSSSKSRVDRASARYA